MIGTKLAHYEITSHLGTGGMGEVYQATDSKLARSVAVKFLPEAFSHDSERVARFEREARMLASLNHPHIAGIYGLEESGERKFLVMELVEGETLAERIKRGPIPVDESLSIAKQICEALEAAHEKGIVHRDLKPGNVKITPDGKVKVLDFGLAKAFEAEASKSNVSQSPTLSMAATNAGMILGTAAYMSPEQVKGQQVDRRTDIFAFGAVLYEMFTGRAVFEGEDVQDILGAVLKSEPDWTRLPAETPPGVRKLLRLCLEKNAKNRRSDATDVRVDIEQALVEPVTAMPETPPARGARLAWIAFAAALLAAVVLAIPAVRYLRETPPSSPPETRTEIVTPATEDPISFALSPDGRQIVFAASGGGASRLWLRSLAATAAQPLAGTEGAVSPFWSPDSRSIGFFADNKLKRLDIGGGAPQTLATVSTTRGGTWNADGVILFTPAQGSPLFRVPASGGEAVAVTKLDRQTSHRFPFFLPDGRQFLFLAQGTPETAGIYLGSLDSTETRG
jgi:eukaryotic-like serine/threonine-protein kinase